MSRSFLPVVAALQLVVAPVAGAARTVIDDAGRAIVLTRIPERIVTLAPSNTEILFALGVGDRIVAVDQWSDYPPAARTRPRIAPFAPSLEQILKLQPDLIVATHGSVEPVLPLERQGIRILVFAPRTLDDIYRNILTMGQIVDAGSRAQRLVREMRQRVMAVLEKVRGAPRPTVFVELDGADPSRPFTAGPGSFIDVLIRLAGGINIAASARLPWPQWSLEELIRTDPDLIVLGDALVPVNPQTPDAVARRAGWQRLGAVRRGAIHAVDAALISRPGPRIVEGLEQLARLLHPHRFR